MKRLYLITGIKGHVGHTVMEKLLAAGEDVRGLIMPGDKTAAPLPQRVEAFEGDVCDMDSLEAFFTTEDERELIVIHTAGIVSIASKYNEKVYRVNVEGTRNIIAQCLRHKVKRLVHVSSVHAIPEKKKGETITEIDRFDRKAVRGLYAQTKAEASQLVLDAAHAGLDAVIVHPSGIIGPGDYGRGHLTQMVVDYLNGRLVACVKGGYDFVDVRDVADGILSAAEKGCSGQCYILSNRFYPVREVLDTVHEITGKKKIRTVLPMWLAKGTAPMAELYYKAVKRPPLYTRYSLFTLTSNSSFSHAKADRELGYSPRGIADTLRDTVDFLIRQGRIIRPGKLCNT